MIGNNDGWSIYLELTCNACSGTGLDGCFRLDGGLPFIPRVGETFICTGEADDFFIEYFGTNKPCGNCELYADCLASNDENVITFVEDCMTVHRVATNMITKTITITIGN